MSDEKVEPILDSGPSLIDLEKTKEKTETIKPILKEREPVPE